MSHEHYPKTDRVEPGSTPGQDPGARRSLEEQRAQGDMPGARTEDVIHGERPGGGDDEEGGDARDEVPPQESVSDEEAERAAERERASQQSPQHSEAPDAEPGGPEARRPVGSTGDVAAQQDVDPPASSSTPEHPMSRSRTED